MKIRKPMVFTAISVALTATPVMAATSISSGFAGPALDTGLTQTHAEPTTTLTLSGTAAFTGGANNNYRSYVSTVGSDYATSTNNWTATIEVQNSGFVGAQLYFGLGTGTTVDFDGPIYGTPQGSTESQPATFMFMYDPAFVDGSDRSLGTVRKQSNQNYWSNETNYTDAQFDTNVGTSGGVASAAFYRYSMAYDYAAQTLTVDVVKIDAFGGTVISSAAGNFGVLSLAGMGYDSSNGKIFFGGNNNSFDNLNVDVTATWSNTGGGLWNTTGNWNDSLVGDGSGRTASFNKLDITADTTVNLDSAWTIGNLVFGDTDTSSAAGWTLANNGNAVNILTLSGTTPTITVNALGGTKMATISAEVAGTQGLTKAGAGTLTLSAANTYTGTTTISAGTLQLGDGGTTGSLSTSSAIINNSNLTINRSNAVVQGTDFSGSAITGSGSLTKAGAGTLTLADTNTYSGGTTVNDGLLVLSGANDGNSIIRGTVTVNAGAELRSTGGDGTGFGWNGAARITTYNINGGLVAAVGKSHVWNATVNLTGGELRSNGGVSDAGTTDYLEWGNNPVNTFASASTAIISGRLRVRADATSNMAFDVADGEAATDLLVSAAITPETSFGGTAVALTKSGAGTMTLSGTNNYTGATTISQGTLLINGNQSGATGAVTVASGATLGGSGTIGGTLAITGILAPGDGGIESLDVNNTVTWKGAASAAAETIWQFELGASNTADLLNITGDFTKDASAGTVFGFNFMNSNFNGTFKLVDWSGTTNFSAGDFSYTNLGGGRTGSFTFNGSSLEFTAVPEPTSALAGLLIAAGLLRRRRA